MKRIFLILMLAAVILCSAFAEVEPPVRYDNIENYAINFAFQPTLARYNAMGQSGLALTTRLDTFYTNPAVLSKKGFALSIPSATVSLYNLAPLLNDEETADIISKILNGKSEKSDIATLATAMLNNLGSGRNLIATIDAGVGLKIGFLGLGTNAQLKIHGLNTGSSYASQTVIPELNAAQTAAFGVSIIDTNALSLSAGLSVHAVYKAYYKALDTGTVLALLDDHSTLMWNQPVMAGFAIPFDVGVNLGLLDDTIVFSATANNINGKYYMKSYSSLGDLTNSENAPDGHVAKDSVNFEISTPWSLNFGFAFAPKVQVLNPVLTLDLVDMFELVKSFGSEDFRASDLLLHMNVGAEVGLFDVLTLRAGVNRGFMSVGAGLWLPVMEVDLSYGWQEYGNTIGDKPVDCLTIKFSLGYDKK